MAFEKIVFAMKTWKDKVSGNTPVTAAELNRIEKGISDCAKQTNALGDSVSQQPKISIGIVVVQYSAIQDSRAKLFTRAEVNSMFGSNANPDKTAVLLTNSNAQYGKTTMAAEYDSRDSTWYVRFTSAPSSNVQITYAVIHYPLV